VVSDRRGLLGSPGRLHTQPLQGRRPTELLPCRDTQISLPSVLPRRRRTAGQVGLKHRGACTADNED